MAVYKKTVSRCGRHLTVSGFGFPGTDQIKMFLGYRVKHVEIACLQTPNDGSFRRHDVCLKARFGFPTWETWEMHEMSCYPFG